MLFSNRSMRNNKPILAIVLSLIVAVATVASVAAATVFQISSDVYTNSTSQHATQVEPDSFSYSSTIVMATQTGRFFDGGASNIAFARSSDGGATWTGGNLPGITKLANPSNPYDRVSDPAVAYDAMHGVWMISSLAITESATGVNGVAVLTSRSTDGGLTWGNPVVVTATGFVDKNWIVCDNTATSPFYGHCYTTWDDNGDGNRLYMSTSTDGGQSWGTQRKTSDNATGIGGQPVVQPNGKVIVPANNADQTAILAFNSTDGGLTWSSSVTVAQVKDHRVAGSLRTSPLPSAEIDGAGKVYVVWQDCRFRRGCKSNDIVMSSSADGITWTPVVRIPIDSVSSKVDHFIPGIAVDQTTSDNTARLALTYYYYDNTNCSASKCNLNVGYVSSPNGGTSWSAPTQLAGPMSLSWLPDTSQGRMVGDYISTSFSGSASVPVFALSYAPSGSLFNQAINTATGLSAAAGSLIVSVGGEKPVPNAASDHAAPLAPVAIH